MRSLPDTFALNTELNMAGTPYFVVRAQPETKVEFAKTKCLTVTLRKVAFIDPRKVLFSLPSISGSALPATEPSQSTSGVHVLHEDDWRQCEFIFTAHAADLSRELEAIQRIHATASAAVGWREIHLRERIASPLAAGTRWSDVTSQIGAVDQGQRIALGHVGRAVAGAVAGRFEDGVIIWGIENAGELSVLCIENVEAASASTIAAFKRVTDAFSLILVHWCRCQAYGPDGLEFENAAGAPWQVAH